MTAAAVCRRLIEATDQRDWATAAEIVDHSTEVTDHRDLPYEGHGARMLDVWRSAFTPRPDARASIEVLEDAPDRALARVSFGEPGRELTVHVIAEVAENRITRFDAWGGDPAGRAAAQERYARATR